MDEVANLSLSCALDNMWLVKRRRRKSKVLASIKQKIAHDCDIDIEQHTKKWTMRKPKLVEMVRGERSHCGCGLWGTLANLMGKKWSMKASGIGMRRVEKDAIREIYRESGWNHIRMFAHSMHRSRNHILFIPSLPVPCFRFRVIYFRNASWNVYEISSYS